MFRKFIEIKKENFKLFLFRKPHVQQKIEKKLSCMFAWNRFHFCFVFKSIVDITYRW